jgi:subtilisin-like proprotein convertase family protein
MEEIAMNEQRSLAWQARTSLVALAVAIVVSGIGAEGAGIAAAKTRASPRTIQTFSNSAPITIASNTQAGPSSIAVGGLKAPIADVDVSLNALTHPTASDLDILLVGPRGQSVLIMSDTGDEALNDSPTFSDQAAERLPSSAPLVSGVFQPTNDDYTSAPDIFAPPAPTTASGSALSVFNGADGNGDWTLFIREQDNIPVQTGSLGGWSLRITTANGAPTTAPDRFQARAGQTLTVPAAGVLENDSDPDGDEISAILAGQPAKGTVRLEADGSFTYRSKKTARGTDTFTYLAKDTTGLTTLETVTLEIKGKRHKSHSKGKR